MTLIYLLQLCIFLHVCICLYWFVHVCVHVSGLHSDVHEESDQAVDGQRSSSGRDSRSHHLQRQAALLCHV